MRLKQCKRCKHDTFYIEGLEIYCSKCLLHIDYKDINRVNTVEPQHFLLFPDDNSQALRCQLSIRQRNSRRKKPVYYYKYNTKYYRNIK